MKQPQTPNEELDQQNEVGPVSLVQFMILDQLMLHLPVNAAFVRGEYFAKCVQAAKSDMKQEGDEADIGRKYYRIDSHARLRRLNDLEPEILLVIQEDKRKNEPSDYLKLLKTAFCNVWAARKKHYVLDKPFLLVSAGGVFCGFRFIHFGSVYTFSSHFLL